MNVYQPTTACPRCGSAADVHAISELADVARMQLGQAPGYPGTQQGAVPGWAQQPSTGPIPDPYGYTGQGGGYRQDRIPGPGSFSPVDDIAGAVVSEAFKFIGRRVGRRMQQTAAQAQSTLAARNQEVLRAQIAIADKYPELRACMTDSVIFLAGGQRVLPMPNLSALTMQQADGLVASLRNG